MKTKNQQVNEQMPTLTHKMISKILLIGCAASINLTFTLTVNATSEGSQYGTEQSIVELTELKQGYRELVELTTQHVSVRDAFHSGYMGRFYASRANVIMCLMGSESILKQAWKISDPAKRNSFVVNAAHQYLFDMQIIHGRIKMNRELHKNANTQTAQQILEMAEKQHLKLKSHYQSRLQRILTDETILKHLTEREILFAKQQKIIR